MKKLIIITGIVIVLVGICIYFFFPCRKSETIIEKKEVFSPKTIKKTQEKVKLNINRYERDIFSLDTTQLASEIKKLHHLYPSTLIEDDAWNNDYWITRLRSYLNDQMINDLYKDVNTIFPNLEEITQELEIGFAHYLNFFPNETVPPIITVLPGLDLQMPSIYIYDDVLYIHLDMYLGQKNRYYAAFGIPKYICERFDKKYLVIDCFKKAIVYKHLPEQINLTILDFMLFEGKKLYFTEMMLPKKEKLDIIGYTTAKFEWAEKYYGNVWSYLIEKNILFTKEENEIRRYIDESPFTNSFGNASPGRLGQFLGWKIIQSYMKNNPEITLEKLLQNTDTQDILNKAKFKPIIR